MSLYNICFGENQQTSSLKTALNLNDYVIGRFRDIYIRDFDDDNDHYLEPGKYIVLLTRNGGGNREEYQECFDDLATHPNYVTNWDCSWDETYAEIIFTIPEKYKQKLINVSPEKDPGEKFEELFEALKNNK